MLLNRATHHIRFAMLVYYKIRQMLLQLFYYKTREKFITKYVRSFITKCDSYYKMRRFYYKTWQLLQNATFMTNCDSTLLTVLQYFVFEIDRKPRRELNNFKHVWSQKTDSNGFWLSKKLFPLTFLSGGLQGITFVTIESRILKTKGQELFPLIIFSNLMCIIQKQLWIKLLIYSPNTFLFLTT